MGNFRIDKPTCSIRVNLYKMCPIATYLKTKDGNTALLQEVASHFGWSEYEVFEQALKEDVFIKLEDCIAIPNDEDETELEIVPKNIILSLE